MEAISTSNRSDPMEFIGMAVLDASGRILEINAELAQSLGMSGAELRGRHFWTELWRQYPEWERTMSEILQKPGAFFSVALSNGTSSKACTMEVCRHGANCFVRIGKTESPSEGTDSDAAWSETLIKLGNGLLHEFNNLMTGLTMITEDHQLQTIEGVAFPEGMEMIKENTLKARRTVERILDLQHSKPGKLEFYDLNELIRDTVELARKIIAPRIKIDLVASPEGLPVELDRVVFRRMILELSSRLAGAMPRGGMLRFETLRYGSVPGGEKFHGVAPSGVAVCLAVRAMAAGSPPMTIADIFNNAAAVENAAGGLPGIRLFLNAHRAAASVQSAETGGPALTIWLPRATLSD